MRVFAIGTEYPFDVAVQRFHDADPREHRRPAQCRDQHQGFHGSLPLRCSVFGFRVANGPPKFLLELKN